MFQCWLRSGLEVVPSVNLISNIGFGEEASHTKNPYDIRSNLPQHSMSFPLREPNEIEIDRDYRKQLSKKLSINKHFLVRLKNKIKIVAASIPAWKN
jgi:hypothetical protein